MIRPVILCGGAGTRLWPVSRQLLPKQFLPLTGPDSLLQQTAARLTGEQFAPAIVVSGEDQRIFIKRQLEQASTPVEAILLEPAGRNTSAAAALAAAWLSASGRDELLLLLPSDHVILNRDAFVKAIAIGAPHAERGAIVTFGAEPTEPNTQYGYVEADMDHPCGDGAFPIARFVEKPNAATATEYLETGRFLWNAGIFLVMASTLLGEMRQLMPASVDAISAAVANATKDGLFVRPRADFFNQAQNISIDHGVMEKTRRGMVVPVDMGWSDVGSWGAVWALGEKDTAGNVLQGDVLAIGTRGSLLRSERDGPLIAAVGVEDLAVIATSDAVFLAPITRASDVKDIVEILRAEGRESVVSSPKLARAWGSCEEIAKGINFEAKHIVVDPGEALLFDDDVERLEHWVVVSGSAELIVEGELSVLREHQSACIAPGAKRHIANSGKVALELIKVECGPQAGTAAKQSKGTAQ
jgi:mannose-1-phosphate guanylyltransferase/mannose-6-phosphate isomerase